MQPGESGKIPLTISTKNRGGRLKKILTVHTNIPGVGGTVRVTVQGELWEPVEVTPRNVSFGRLTHQAAQEAPVTRKLTIVNNMGEPANLTNVRSTSPLFHVETVTVETGRKYELTVTLASAPRQGHNRARIEASTGITEKPTLSIPVSLYMMADVDVQPDKLMLPSNRPAGIKRQFKVQNNTGQPLTISDLKTTNLALTLSLQEIRPGMMYQITVDVPAVFTSSPGGDTITFTTDCPAVPLVTIPITQIPTRTAPVRSQP